MHNINLTSINAEDKGLTVFIIGECTKCNH
jgi:hypothetical protein